MTREALIYSHGALRRFAVWMLALLLAVSQAAWADLPDAVRAQVTGLEKVGSGLLRWFGIRVYTVTLWSRNGEYDPRQLPYVLEIHYHRNFTADQLISSTVDEMRRMGLEDDQAQAWAEELKSVVPDIRAGDRLIGLQVPGSETTFFGNTSTLGSITDPEFGPAFFAIWLDSRSRVQGLRRQLLGNSP